MAAPGSTRPNFTATRPSSSSPPSGSPQVDGLGDALLQQGKAESVRESRVWAQAVVAKLKKEGLMGASLKATLAKVQAQAGLAQTGRLDGPTIRFMQSKGWAPPQPTGAEAGKDGKQAGDAKAGESAAKADGTKGADKASSTNKTSTKPDNSDAAKTAKGGKAGQGPSKARDPQRLTARRPVGQVPGEAGGLKGADVGGGAAKGGLGEILQNLMSLGFLGGLRGGEALSDAIRSFQASVGLPASGQMNRPTESALKKAVDSSDVAMSTPDAPEGGGSAKGRGAEAKADAKSTTSTKGAKEAARSTSNAQGAQKSTPTTPEQARSSTQTGQDAAMRGVATPTDAQAVAGRAADGKGQAVATGQGGDGSGQVKGASGAVETDDVDGTEDVDTNAHAGDEDLIDEERGWANIKGDGEEVGYWEMGPLSGQIKAALDAIARRRERAGDLPLGRHLLSAGGVWRRPAGDPAVAHRHRAGQRVRCGLGERA